MHLVQYITLAGAHVQLYQAVDGVVQRGERWRRGGRVHCVRRDGPHQPLTGVDRRVDLAIQRVNGPVQLELQGKVLLQRRRRRVQPGIESDLE